MKVYLIEYIVYQIFQIIKFIDSKFFQNRLNFKPKQTPLNIIILFQEVVDSLDKKAGYIIFCGLKLFTIYCEPYIKVLFNELQFVYTIPSRTTFIIKILNLCYEETKDEIEKKLRLIKKWNIIINESSNINKNRIIHFVF
jgi:hypothetical protein